MNTFDIGDRVRMEATFKDYDDVLTSGTVVCTVRDPSGNEEAVDAELESTGLYYAYVTVDESGTWRYRFEATGAIVGAGENAFVVRKSWFA